ncbi:MAG: hypothetical protein R3D85_02990 [Paracoccaceae bacterium]
MERIAGVVFALMVVSGVLAVSAAPVAGVGFAMAAGGVLLWQMAPRSASVAS